MSGTKAFDRGLDILFVLSQSDSPLTVSEIALRIDVPESTVYRLLHALEQRDLITREGRGEVRLGLALLDLARACRRQLKVDLVGIARPHMQDLTARTGETTILTMPASTGAVCVHAVDSPQAIRLSHERGRMLPYYAGASASVFLASRDEETLEKVFMALEHARQAGESVMTPARLNERMQFCRAHGYVVTHGEVDAGAVGIGMPIHNEDGDVIAALTLAGPPRTLSR